MEEPKYHLQGVVKSREQMEDFDGPLDVILLLLSKNKIEIRDIQICLLYTSCPSGPFGTCARLQSGR